jgi:hypothetical protein
MEIPLCNFLHSLLHLFPLIHLKFNPLLHLFPFYFQVLQRVQIVLFLSMSPTPHKVLRCVVLQENCRPLVIWKYQHNCVGNRQLGGGVLCSFATVECLLCCSTGRQLTFKTYPRLFLHPPHIDLSRSITPGHRFRLRAVQERRHETIADTHQVISGNTEFKSLSCYPPYYSRAVMAWNLWRYLSVIENTSQYASNNHAWHSARRSLCLVTPYLTNWLTQ